MIPRRRKSIRSSSIYHSLALYIRFLMYKIRFLFLFYLLVNANFPGFVYDHNCHIKNGCVLCTIASRWCCHLLECSSTVFKTFALGEYTENKCNWWYFKIIALEIHFKSYCRSSAKLPTEFQLKYWTWVEQKNIHQVQKNVFDRTVLDVIYKN